MKHNYLTAIDVMISTHRAEAERHLREVERLSIARDVLEDLKRVDGQPTLLLHAERLTVSEPAGSGPLTIRKKVPERPTRERRKFEPVRSADLKGKILVALSQPMDMKLSDVTDALGIDRKDKQARSRAWYALDQMIKAGEVAKDGNNYILPSEHEALANTG